MHAGDAVLQPPEIRHRVLESSAAFEVVEIGCPAEHDTMGEHSFDLPTPFIRPDRDFGGQRFVHHVAATATYEPWHFHGFEVRNTGIDEATGGIGDVRVARSTDAVDIADQPWRVQDREFSFWFVLEGATVLHLEELDSRQAERREVALDRGDSVSLPRSARYRFASSPGLELLQVSVSEDRVSQDRWRQRFA
jgi:mannose-6-phosphate isomerase-like protein (cupin superfamily)